MSEDNLTEADWDAIGAARNAEPAPDYVIHCQPMGECTECGERFLYGHPTDVGNLDPCPECYSYHWEKWGYQTPEGEEIPKDEIRGWEPSD